MNNKLLMNNLVNINNNSLWNINMFSNNLYNINMINTSNMLNTSNMFNTDNMPKTNKMFKSSKMLPTVMFNSSRFKWPDRRLAAARWSTRR